MPRDKHSRIQNDAIASETRGVTPTVRMELGRSLQARYHAPMIIGNYRRFAVECRVDFRAASSGLGGLVGSITLWVDGCQYGRTEYKATCLAMPLAHIRERTPVARDPSSAVLYRAEPLAVFHHFCQEEFGVEWCPKIDVLVNDEVREIAPRQFWRSVLAWPNIGETFDDGSHVFFGVGDDVRVCAARRTDTEYVDLHSAHVSVEEFEYIIRETYDWAAKCPFSWFEELDQSGQG